MKVSRESVKQAYSVDGTVDYYTKAVVDIGIWNSEKALFAKYINSKEDSILDLGCGAGRIAIGLYQAGYHNIVGIDLSDAMIEKAIFLSRQLEYPIPFQQGDAVNLGFPDQSIHFVVFSFNGLMLIPGIENRIEAVREIHRVLKPAGHLIFTTHDRDRQPEMSFYWKTEVKKWKKGKNEPWMYDYGDKIIDGKAERTYLHFPNRKEILYTLKTGGMEPVDDFWRVDRYEENEKVVDFSTGCRFWIARKPV